jgi:hypothetical protein
MNRERIGSKLDSMFEELGDKPPAIEAQAQSSVGLTVCAPHRPRFARRPLPLRGRGGMAASRPGGMADDVAAARGEAMGRNGLVSSSSR